MATNATILKVDRDHACALWRNVMIFIWRGVTRPETVDEHRNFVEKHTLASRGAFSFFVVTEPQSEMPDGPTRDKLAMLLRGAGPAGCCAALVYEGAGFRGAAVRGIVGALNALARQPFPYKVFATVEAGATWVASTHSPAGESVNAADLSSIVASLRASA
jgi:hypothetical protein